MTGRHRTVRAVALAEHDIVCPDGEQTTLDDCTVRHRRLVLVRRYPGQVVAVDQAGTETVHFTGETVWIVDPTQEQP